MEELTNTDVNTSAKESSSAQQEFYGQYYQMIKDIVEVDEVADSQLLEDFEEWDSLSALSIMANIGEKFGVTINSQVLRDYKTVGSLKAFVAEKLGL